MERFGDDQAAIWQHSHYAANFIVATPTGVYVREPNGNPGDRTTERPEGRGKTGVNMLTKGLAKAEATGMNVDHHAAFLNKIRLHQAT
jgi:hypothetical protein